MEVHSVLSDLQVPQEEHVVVVVYLDQESPQSYGNPTMMTAVSDCFLRIQKKRKETILHFSHITSCNIKL